MRRYTDEEWEMRRVEGGTRRLSLWRRVLTVLVATAFTVSMISLGLLRHRHLVREQPGLPFAASSPTPESERSP